MRYLAALLLLGSWVTASHARQTPPGPLDGVWEITALIDDGEVVSNEIVRKSLTTDGRMTVRGQTLSFTKTSGQPKTVLFTVDPQTNPPSIDLGGADKPVAGESTRWRATPSWSASVAPRSASARLRSRRRPVRTPC